VIHQDAPHDASSHRQEVPAVGTRDRAAALQPQIRLVDERRSLEAVPHALAGHAAACDPLELPMDERNQSLEGFLLALSPFEKQPGDLRRMVADAPMLDRFVAWQVPPPLMEETASHS
jgi:hypothetical protein